MTALHGFANAFGARLVVLSLPVRRTLVLLGLLCGALAALWILGASSAQAAESEGLAPAGDTGLVETTGRVDGALTEAPHEGAEAVAPRATEKAETVLEPVTETVEPVHEAFDTTLEGTAAEVGGHIEGTAAPAAPADAGQDTETGTGQGRSPQPAADPAEETEPEAGTAERVHETPYVLDGLPEPGGTDTGATAPATEDAPPSATVPADPTASAHIGTATGPACANFPSRVGIPAPTPGLDQAARHFLHAVPSAAADEPTFAPD
ncbi:hypothetical protein [Nocardiopsis ganjiahuensis]|uniref:hypothetical protein n=1 Tax=Nocardiopsis ganjiahuensis TaxID=239984 RepID=UPI000349C249|nr:hypothetical protein [Nocardiopsis ganjiahuensis]